MGWSSPVRIHPKNWSHRQISNKIGIPLNICDISIREIYISDIIPNIFGSGSASASTSPTHNHVGIFISNIQNSMVFWWKGLFPLKTTSLMMAYDGSFWLCENNKYTLNILFRRSSRYQWTWWMTLTTIKHPSTSESNPTHIYPELISNAYNCIYNNRSGKSFFGFLFYSEFIRDWIYCRKCCHVSCNVIRSQAMKWFLNVLRRNSIQRMAFLERDTIRD